MPEEMEPLRALLQPKEIYHNKVVHIEQAGDLLLLQSGIGKANAAAACALLFQLFKPAALLNIGSAGGFAHSCPVLPATSALAKCSPPIAL